MGSAWTVPVGTSSARSPGVPVEPKTDPGACRVWSPWPPGTTGLHVVPDGETDQWPDTAGLPPWVLPARLRRG